MAVFQSCSSPSSRTTLLLAAFVVLLTACAAPSPRSGSAGSGDAERAYDEGRYRDAARAFRIEAQSVPARRDALLVRAADAAFRAGDLDQTRDLLIGVQFRALDDADRSLAAVLTAASDESLPAHQILSRLNIDDSTVPADYRRVLHNVRARAYLESGQPYPSARERIRLAPWLVGEQEQKDNREAILSTLQRLSARQAVDLMQRHDPQDEMYGWLALVATLKSGVFSGQSASGVINVWRAQFPDHPANRESIATLLTGYNLTFAQPQRVALLLPLTGDRLPRSARAVRDGFLSAFYADGQRQSEVRIYDVGSDPRQAIQQYRRAVSEGATQIVGPLQKESVTALLLEADGTVPILALNFQEGNAPTAPGIYQFGLQPEEEARIAAERMMEDGHWRALSLTPRSTLGDRMELAFVERFEQLGGQVLGRYRYNEAEVDFGPVIQQATGITDANLRERQLQRVLGTSLSFEAQRRHDADAIFVAARPRQGRQIKPQLAFYNAGDLPTYSTSHIYSGRQDPDADRDLNGVLFCDAPWLLGGQSFQPSLESVREAFPDARGPSVRLFAVGVDAYRLLPYLSWLARNRSDSFPGVTGQLSIDARGRVRRSLDCAVFRGGVARYQPTVTSQEVAGR